jgi:capsular polysaccharide biosynthesis protein
MLGLILSFGGAAGIAVVRDYLDETVRSAADIAVLGVPPLATIRFSMRAVAYDGHSFFSRLG